MRVFGSGEGIGIFASALSFDFGTLLILEHFNSGIMEGDLELQLDSSYQEASDRALITVLGDSMEMEEGSGTRNIQVNTRSVDQDVEGYFNVKKRALNKSRSGYDGNLTTISNEITRLMEHGGTQEEISKEMENLNDEWIKFVDAHDKYCKCYSKRYFRALYSGSNATSQTRSPAIPSLSTVNYLNETVSGTFTPHSKLPNWMFTRRDDWKICGIVDGIFINKWLSFRFRILRMWSCELRNRLEYKTGISRGWGWFKPKHPLWKRYRYFLG